MLVWPVTVKVFGKLHINTQTDLDLTYPNSLVDLLDTGDREQEEEEEEKSWKDEFDFEGFSESDGEWWSATQKTVTRQLYLRSIGFVLNATVHDTK